MKKTTKIGNFCRFRNTKRISKKGQGLSLNTIIVAAIVLIVLVVLWAIFTGRMGVFSKGISDVTKGGTCAEASGKVKTEVEGCTSACIRVYGQFSDITAGQICCKPAKAEACTQTYIDNTGTTQECGNLGGENACLNQDGCEWETIDQDSC